MILTRRCMRLLTRMATTVMLLLCTVKPAYRCFQRPDKGMTKDQSSIRLKEALVRDGTWVKL